MRKLKITELNRLTPEAFKDSKKIPLVVVLDHVRSLNNVGSVWEYFEDTMEAVDKLKQQGYTVCAVEQAEGSTMLDNLLLDKNKKYAVIMGNEVKGVQQCVVDNCDMCIEIPQYGTKHSLNVSVTTGIIIWDFFKQLSD